MSGLDYASRAAAGAALLDKDAGSFWWHRIDADALDMGDVDKDVLGQLYGTFVAGVSKLDLNRIVDTSGNLDGDTFALGFDLEVDDEFRDAAFAALTAAWRVEIEKRCAA